MYIVWSELILLKGLLNFRHVFNIYVLYLRILICTHTHVGDRKSIPHWPKIHMLLINIKNRLDTLYGNCSPSYPPPPRPHSKNFAGSFEVFLCSSHLLEENPEMRKKAKINYNTVHTCNCAFSHRLNHFGSFTSFVILKKNIVFFTQKIFVRNVCVLLI